MHTNECYSENKGNWYENIEIEGINIRFKLDSGSDTSILSKSTVNILPRLSVLTTTPVTLISYGNFKFKPMGQIYLNCTYSNVTKKIRFNVVKFDAETLLGMDDCVQLLPKTKVEKYSKYHDLSEGLVKIL